MSNNISNSTIPLSQDYFNNGVEDFSGYEDIDDVEEDSMTESQLSIRDLAVNNPKLAVDKLIIKYGKLKNDHAVLKNQLSIVSFKISSICKLTSF